MQSTRNLLANVHNEIKCVGKWFVCPLKSRLMWPRPHPPMSGREGVQVEQDTKYQSQDFSKQFPSIGDSSLAFVRFFIV